MEPSPLIMVVEDDVAVRMAVADHLTAAGGNVIQYGDGAAALAAVRTRMPDLMIVDRMLPRMNGDDLCRSVREVADIPIIMLTALDGAQARIDGLESGADDYLAKPFVLRELQLRVQALLRRRSSPSPPGLFSSGVFRVDPASRRVWVCGREATLTVREYELFLYLVSHAGRVVARDEILREVWRWGFGGSHTITVHVRRLREKIETDPSFPSYLRTEWGVGYRLVTGED